MDDDKTIDTATYKLTIADEEYEFGEPDAELFKRMVLIKHMSAGGLLTMEAITKWLASAAGPTVWAQIMQRFLDGDVTIEHLMETLKEFVKLVNEKQVAATDAE
jgi:hypothetical protein